MTWPVYPPTWSVFLVPGSLTAGRVTRWPRPIGTSRRRGLPNAAGEPFVYDSAWRLRLESITWGTEDPGRMVSEIRKELCDSTRKCAELIAYQQVE
jgi:hypothetical protein